MDVFSNYTNRKSKVLSLVSLKTKSESEFLSNQRYVNETSLFWDFEFQISGDISGRKHFVLVCS